MITKRGEVDEFLVFIIMFLLVMFAIGWLWMGGLE